MNIFILDRDKEKCARYHVNSHVVKMPTETAQILSTAVQVCRNKRLLSLYKPTHENHPCAIWARSTQANFIYLYELGIALCDEYTHRYGKIHKASRMLDRCYRYANAIPEGPLTPFAQAMPEQYQTNNAVKAYRAYYIGDKQHLALWKNSDKPNWYSYE